MKKINRLVLGLFSSLLLTAGFARAADRFDPMSAGLPERVSHLKAAPGTVFECEALDAKAAPDTVFECDLSIDAE